MLQPLGWRLLAPSRSSFEWTSDTGLNAEAKGSEFVQQGRFDSIYLVLLPGRERGVERQTNHVSDAKGDAALYETDTGFQATRRISFLLCIGRPKLYTIS